MNSLHLLYHELRPVPSNYSYVLECAAFEEHCGLFAELRNDPGEALLPVVTFDDGHRSNYDFAVPILQKYALKATFFITAGWTGQRSGYMGWNELRAIHAGGHSIGAHGWSHALLTHCTPTELHQELAGARERLEDGLGAGVSTMSLPGGRVNARVLQACWDAGYKAVFTSNPRAQALPLPDGRVTVGRLNVRSAMKTSDLQRILLPATGALAALERSDRIKAVAKSILGDRVYAGLWALLNRQEPETDPAGASAE